MWNVVRHGPNYDGRQNDVIAAAKAYAERHAAAVTAAKDAEIAALRADFTALQRAIVGDTGASAILEAGRLRAEVAGLRAELLKSLADNAALRERVKVLEDALLRVARMAEALKKDCGMDPESPQAVRNGQYMNISYAARAALEQKP
jgi:hypothetical protein